MSSFYTKINSGFLKGKILKLPSLNLTRSTKNIVKGSFFNSFRFDLKDRVFIEMFGGSGSMAAEAVSNFAKIGIAIEKDRSAFNVLNENFINLKQNLKAYNGDAFELMNEILMQIDDEIILYIDPPFNIREGFLDVYEKVANFIQNLSAKNIFLIAIEHNSEIKFDEKISKFKKIKTKKFGSTSLSYYKIEL
ncbi:16S rRNA (guanine(966)-N(2))-methyltransferase RsmD [Campylobacter sp. FMV-PI01]|uniref:16S rRNA (Guanine(966)-N(2))-methyltransferase RsmD n=1 Tax=Campylobacter portucalensis TaxID=2608384 RepID=A0A6L5WJH5_9BACT|nr:RsmD family RNA methyltransferase [Campylobacter portucalensis]MSN97096.1 16S rRNA (guanine(966)-N(2))-methyltransferase RsmD [Campylobacter portucalensis]